MAKIELIGIYLLVLSSILFEAYGLQCLKCNSKTNSKCIDPDESVEASECENEKDQSCVTAIVDGETIRDCESNLTYATQKIKCSTEKCNNEIYPKDRLRCYQCNGKDCVTSNSAQLSVCRLLIPNDSCYTYVETINNVYRGCLSDKNKPTSEYLKCKENGCNDQPGFKDYSCLYCKSENDPNCKRIYNDKKECNIEEQVPKCKSQVLLGREFDGCFTYHNGETVERGCYNGDNVKNFNKDNLKTCTKNNCNNECISQPECMICDSNNDENCFSKPIASEVCTGNVSSCHTCWDSGSGNLIRGCGKGSDKMQCEYCQDGKNCNAVKKVKCHKCNSKETKTCSNDLTHVTKEDYALCSNKCITVVEGEDTIRGCVNDLKDCSDKDSKCNSCTEDLCNKMIVPEDRKQCYQCDENDENCNEIKENTETEVCQNYNPEDECFSYATSENKMVRGCKSDKKHKDCVQMPSCIECEENACNTISLKLDSNFSCIKCNKTTECSWGFETKFAEKCSNKVLYYLNETCYTKVYENGLISRGCTHDDDECSEDDTNCTECNTPGCNSKNFEYQYCLQCNSKDNDKCLNKGEGVESKKCPGDVQLYSKRGCYSRVKDKIVSRGCSTELSDKELAECKKKDSKDCKFCDKQNCNIDEMKSSSQQIESFSIVLTLILSYVAIKEF